LILFTVPLGYSIFAAYFNQEGGALTLDFAATFQSIFGNVLLPVFLGVVFRQMFLQLVIKTSKPLKYLSSLLLAIVFGIKIFAGEEKGGVGLEMGEIIAIMPILLLIHFTSMFLSYFLSKAIKIEQFRALTISSKHRDVQAVYRLCHVFIFYDHYVWLFLKT